MSCVKPFVLVICCLCSLFVLSGASKKWPSRFPRCYRDDPNLNKCIVKATETMRPYLKEGIPEFNIPPISPFTVPEVVIQQGSDAANFKLVLTNLTIIGFDSYEFERFDYDSKKSRFDAYLHMGTLKLKSNYQVSGKLLATPIEGHGTMSFTVLSAEGTLTQNSKLVTRNSNTYMELERPEINVNIENVTDYEYNGLFEGNEVLAKAADKVFKDNLKEIIEEIKPAVNKVIEEIVYDLQKKSIYKVPYDEIYPSHT